MNMPGSTPKYVAKRRTRARFSFRFPIRINDKVETAMLARAAMGLAEFVKGDEANVHGSSPTLELTLRDKNSQLRDFQ
jgi:hypothetical protein